MTDREWELHWRQWMLALNTRDSAERLAAYEALFRPDEWVRVKPGIEAAMRPLEENPYD